MRTDVAGRIASPAMAWAGRDVRFAVRSALTVSERICTHGSAHAAPTNRSRAAATPSARAAIHGITGDVCFASIRRHFVAIPEARRACVERTDSGNALRRRVTDCDRTVVPAASAMSALAQRDARTATASLPFGTWQTRPAPARSLVAGVASWKTAHAARATMLAVRIEISAACATATRRAGAFAGLPAARANASAADARIRTARFACKAAPSAMEKTRSEVHATSTADARLPHPTDAPEAWRAAFVDRPVAVVV